MGNQALAVHQRRHGGAVERRRVRELPGEVVPPEDLSILRVKTGEDAANSECVEPPGGEYRGRLRPRAVRDGRRMHHVRRRVVVAPDLLAGRQVQAADHLIIADAAEDVRAIAYRERRGVAKPDVDLPATRQLCGPAIRYAEARNPSVASRPPPLVPIRR